jgi:hypothetical protein
MKTQVQPLMSSSQLNLTRMKFGAKRAFGFVGQQRSTQGIFHESQIGAPGTTEHRLETAD